MGTLRYLCVVVTVVGFVSPACGQSFYDVVDLGTLGGTTSLAFGINELGQVTGQAFTSNFEPHAFLYDGSMHDLGTLGGSLSSGRSINDSGQVAGYSFVNGNASYHAFLYDGMMHDLGTNGGSSSAGNGINNAGHVTGSARNAFLYDGMMHDLGTLGGFYSEGTAINNVGQITGASAPATGSARAFLYDGTMHDLGAIAGDSSLGTAINDLGHVTGQSSTTAGANLAPHAFLHNGTMRDLGTLGGTSSIGHGINNHGHVTGASDTAGNTARHAFVYDATYGMIDLNSKIASGTGWLLSEARDINNHGQIVGFGTRNAETRAFLLNPYVPTSPSPIDSHLPELTNSKNLVLVTHGWRNDDITWVNSMRDSLLQKLPTGQNGWDVIAYDWTDLNDGEPSDALSSATTLGIIEGKILGSRLIAGEHYEHIHLIAHSAGSAFIENVAQNVRAVSPETTLHLTFLDAYAPSFYSANYGGSATWADHYFTRDTFLWTQERLANAHNVDISALDDGINDHSFPHDWYQQTIDAASPQIDWGPYGFQLSREASVGQWAPQLAYPDNALVELPFSSSSPPPQVLTRTDEVLILDDLNHVTSDTGTVIVAASDLMLETGSPVWFTAIADLTEPINFVSFNLEFTSDAGARGILSFHFDGRLVGTVDELYAFSGSHTYFFGIEQVGPGSYFMSFRLDPYADIASSVAVNSVQTGLVAPVPEPSGLLLCGLGFVILVTARLRSAAACAALLMHRANGDTI